MSPPGGGSAALFRALNLHCANPSIPPTGVGHFMVLVPNMLCHSGHHVSVDSLQGWFPVQSSDVRR